MKSQREQIKSRINAFLCWHSDIRAEDEADFMDMNNCLDNAAVIFRDILAQWDKYYPDPKVNMDEPVDVIVYGMRRHYTKRSKAIEDYERYIVMSEGSERERYVTILTQLKDGLKTCTDVQL